VGLVAPGSAKPEFELGPAIGSKAPTIGAPLDSMGKPRPLESLMGDKGLVLVFYRSAAWCSYCQLQLMDLNGCVAEVEKRGYRIAAISYEKPPVNADFIENR